MSDASDVLAKEVVERGGRIFDLEQDNKRLRKLISDFGAVTQHTNFGIATSCIYCGGEGEIDDATKHFTHCPAFHPDGTVK